jgi:hypothetical protein
MFIGNSNNNNTNNNLNGASSNTQGNDLAVIGRKRKRISKFKKAVYKYRFQKKQFIVNHLFNLEEKNSNVEKVENLTTQINNDNISQQKEEIIDTNIHKQVNIIPEKAEIKDENILTSNQVENFPTVNQNTYNSQNNFYKYYNFHPVPENGQNNLNLTNIR